MIWWIEHKRLLKESMRLVLIVIMMMFDVFIKPNNKRPIEPPPLILYLMDFGLFSKFIMSVTLPNNFKLPFTFSRYGGSGDPQVHVIMFKSMMLLNGASGPFFCWGFPTFLEKSTLLWFSSFRIRSVHDFSELLEASINRFSSSRVCQKTLDALNAMKQEPQESLKEYLDYFNAVAM